jgi:hypothetical protein
MKLSTEIEKFLLSGKELRVIYSALLEFAWQIYERLDSTDDKGIFTKTFEEKFGFSLDGLGYTETEVIALYKNLKVAYGNPAIILEEKFIIACSLAPKKPLIIYTALNECIQNYEDYEIAVRAGLKKEEFESVLNDFKNLFPELERREA